MSKRRFLSALPWLGGPWARGSLALLLLVSLILIVMDRADPENSPFLPLKRTMTDVTMPVMSVVSAPFRGAQVLGQWVADNWKAASRVHQLEEENRKLLQWRDLALSLHEKMKVYEQFLKVPASPVPVVVTARVVADPGGTFVRARLINAGRHQGIAEGQAVLGYEGMIGRIMIAGKRSARVLLLTDLNSRVPVLIDGSDVHAILAGDNSDFPALLYLPRNAELVSGARIITSGDGGVLPRGLPIGTLLQRRDGSWRAALFAKGDTVDFAQVLSLPPLPAPEDETENSPPAPMAVTDNGEGQ